jgi:hypothetical protein
MEGALKRRLTGRALLGAVIATAGLALGSALASPARADTFTFDGGRMDLGPFAPFSDNFDLLRDDATPVSARTAILTTTPATGDEFTVAAGDAGFDFPTKVVPSVNSPCNPNCTFDLILDEQATGTYSASTGEMTMDAEMTLRITTSNPSGSCDYPLSLALSTENASPFVAQNFSPAASPTTGSIVASWSGIAPVSGTGDCGSANGIVGASTPGGVWFGINMNDGVGPPGTGSPPAAGAPRPKVLSVSVTGSGTVTGPGIDCPGDCFAAFAPNTTVELTANGVGGETLTGWGGACSAIVPPDNTCDVTMDGDKGASATFTGSTLPVLFVTRSGGSGDGSVTSEPPGIDCPGTCAATFPENQEVQLTATPDAESGFKFWGGISSACTGVANPCTLNMGTADKSANVFFDRTYTVTVTNVTGMGAVVSDDVSLTPIYCPDASCSKDYFAGTDVSLTAFPTRSDWAFQSWGGACTGAAVKCSLPNLSSDKSLTAVFGAMTQPVAPTQPAAPKRCKKGQKLKKGKCVKKPKRKRK